MNKKQEKSGIIAFWISFIILEFGAAGFNDLGGIIFWTLLNFFISLIVALIIATTNF